MMTAPLKAPFPYFGGKSKIAAEVWARFGDPGNFVEPFMGSGAVLLARPHAPRSETVNDLNCMVANFWRAIARDPWGVARWADWPMNEADMHARHAWLVGRQENGYREEMLSNPDLFDVKIAGWWVWGISQWLGSGWCSNQDRRRPSGHGMGVHRKRPNLRRGGRGVGNTTFIGKQERARTCRERAEGLVDWFEVLRDRLRMVRICCGDWRRVVQPSITYHVARTAVFLDPPYPWTAGRDRTLYASEDIDVANDVAEWAIEMGEREDMRIALCGYDAGRDQGDLFGGAVPEIPASWECLKWQSSGGYGASRKGRGWENRKRERIWFSPHCLKAKE